MSITNIPKSKTAFGDIKNVKGVLIIVKKILVSKCLLGINCRYKGDNCKNEAVCVLGERYEIIGVCPEQDGGLPTPRDPAEIVGDRVISSSGRDVTAEYNKGAHHALELAKSNKIEFAVLKSKSPSCGCGTIYDGTFSGKLTIGDGVTSKLLKENGFKVIDENEIE